MRAKRKTVNTENTENSQSATSIRASISFPSEVYETLEIIAKEKKVSLAWVVREATEKYIADKWPLLAGHRTPEPD